VPGFGIIFDPSGTESKFTSDSHEGRVDFDYGKITGFVGVNFTRTRDDESNASEFAPVNSLDAPNSLSLFPLGPGLPIPTAVAFRRNTYLRRTENVFSGFGLINFKATDALTLTLEGRFTNEKLRITDLLAPDIGGTGAGFLAVTPPTGTRNASFFTPRGSISYKFGEESSIYASVARGYKSGGLNGIAANYIRNSTVGGVVVPDIITVGQAIPAPRAGATAVAFVQTTPGSAGLNVTQASYNAETNWTYEIGSKNRFMDGKLTLNPTQSVSSRMARRRQHLPSSCLR
jgi:iron complex outermembrane recepter protein